LGNSRYCLREFEVAIEACVDIASHIISEKYTDIADILVNKEVISKEYGKLLKKIISFRNIIFHEYLNINFKKVYENLQKIDDLAKFAEYIEKFLEKEQ